MPFGRKAPAPRDPSRVRLFNVDFHLAVIADVKVPEFLRRPCLCASHIA